MSPRFDTYEDYENFLKDVPDKDLQYVPEPSVSDEDFMSGKWQPPSLPRR